MAPGLQQDSPEICDRPIQPLRGFSRAIDVEIRANENRNNAGFLKISAIEAIDIDGSSTGAEMNDLCVQPIEDSLRAGIQSIGNIVGADQVPSRTKEVVS